MSETTIGTTRLYSGALHALAERGGIINFSGCPFIVTFTRQGDFSHIKLVAIGKETKVEKNVIYKKEKKAKTIKKAVEDIEVLL